MMINAHRKIFDDAALTRFWEDREGHRIILELLGADIFIPRGTFILTKLSRLGEKVSRAIKSFGHSGRDFEN